MWVTTIFSSSELFFRINSILYSPSGIMFSSSVYRCWPEPSTVFVNDGSKVQRVRFNEPINSEICSCVLIIKEADLWGRWQMEERGDMDE